MLRDFLQHFVYICLCTHISVCSTWCATCRHLVHLSTYLTCVHITLYRIPVCTQVYILMCYVDMCTVPHANYKKKTWIDLPFKDLNRMQSYSLLPFKDLNRIRTPSNFCSFNLIISLMLVIFWEYVRICEWFLEVINCTFCDHIDHIAKIQKKTHRSKWLEETMLNV